jgi:cyclohexanone monooxygenase
MTTIVDKDAIKQKYAAERAKRLRPDGNGQYQRLSGKFEGLATDPHTPFVPRDPVTDHVTFAFIGAGMSA